MRAAFVVVALILGCFTMTGAVAALGPSTQWYDAAVGFVAGWVTFVTSVFGLHALASRRFGRRST